MDKDKALLRHEILNIFTLLNFEVAGTDLDEAKKAGILRHLKLLTLLIKHEDVFVGKQSELFKTEVDLGEILEIVVMIHQKEFERRDIKLTVPGEAMMVEVDRKLLQETLEEILVKLMASATTIDMTQENGTLKIAHNASERPEDKRVDLMECLTDKTADFSYQLALRLLELNGATLKSENGLISISFS